MTTLARTKVKSPPFYPSYVPSRLWRRSDGPLHTIPTNASPYRGDLGMLVDGEYNLGTVSWFTNGYDSDPSTFLGSGWSWNSGGYVSPPAWGDFMDGASVYWEILILTYDNYAWDRFTWNISWDDDSGWNEAYSAWFLNPSCLVACRTVAGLSLEAYWPSA